ncbi:MAG: ABC transporter ATP-binding protein [Planctomycetes bacterium]|nr:ABC transporter ATP-binding protein [Planctomycetota bacterium]
MTDRPHMLNANAVVFAYRDDRDVLRGVSISASPGELTCLLGPNGSGKTTLLRCLLGRLAPSAGEVMLDGRNVREYSPSAIARLMAYVPQFPRSALAFPVWRIVMMGRFAHTGVLGLPGKKDHDIARQAMIMTQTDQFAERTLDEISGGEAQRVMIARALAQQPSVMLLDEPTSHLDIKNQLMIYDMMRRLAHDWPMAVVCVSHDVNLAGRFADHLVMMRSGEVLAAGPCEEVIRRDILHQVYDVEVDLIDAGAGQPPIVRAKQRPTGENARQDSQ